KSFKNRVGRNLLTHPLLKERLLRQAESRKTVSRSFGYENRRICFRTTRC
ncbi:cytoplasmic protein, partial [Salmonella enterica]|nr:cytoplasmic protein [Salmonella enterica]